MSLWYQILWGLSSNEHHWAMFAIQIRFVMFRPIRSLASATVIHHELDSMALSPSQNSVIFNALGLSWHHGMKPASSDQTDDCFHWWSSIHYPLVNSQFDPEKSLFCSGDSSSNLDHCHGSRDVRDVIFYTQSYTHSVFDFPWNG